MEEKENNYSELVYEEITKINKQLNKIIDLYNEKEKTILINNEIDDLKKQQLEHSKILEEYSKILNKIKQDEINSFNEYDKIILNNLESRISILEEENESYIKK